MAEYKDIATLNELSEHETAGLQVQSTLESLSWDLVPGVGDYKIKIDKRRQVTVRVDDITPDDSKPTQELETQLNVLQCFSDYHRDLAGVVSQAKEASDES
jgi:hypothetical protein